MPFSLRIDQFLFSVVTLNDYPEHGAMLNRISSSFSFIESLVGAVYGILKHQTPEQGLAELTKFRGNAERVRKVQQQLRTAPPPTWSDETHAVLERVLNFAVRRNDIAHGIWGSVEGEKDILYHLDVKKIIPFVALMAANATAGRPLEGVNDLKAKISQYSVTDLVALGDQADQLLKDLFECYYKICQLTVLEAGWNKFFDLETGKEGLCSPPVD